MNWHRKTSGLIVTTLGCMCLSAIFFLTYWIKAATLEAQISLMHLKKERDLALTGRDANKDLLNLKRGDVETFKAALENEATSKKNMFEAGVMLHDEKRLLEKQWDIMTTSVLVDGDAKKVSLLKDEVPVSTFFLTTPPTIYGSTPTLRGGTTMRVTAKERFAHPERGKAENVNGVLQWTPPQVGTSVRANALGEYVIFTDASLIIHGPPTKPEDHEHYSHLCLNLPLAAAKKLYEKTYIGTKINVIYTQPAQPMIETSTAQ